MTANFKERISSLVNELKSPKTQKNKFGDYYYRSLEDILQAVKPLLFKYGMILNMSDDIVLVGDRYYIKSTATLEDIESDQKVISSGFAREIKERKKYDESQLTGSASSYARKYALNGLFNIDDTKDSDFMNNLSQNNSSQTEEKQDPNLISDNQRRKLFAVSSKNGMSNEQVSALIKTFGYDSTKKIQKKDFDSILSMIGE